MADPSGRATDDTCGADADPDEVLRLRARILITRAMSRFGMEGPQAGLAVLGEVHAMLDGSSSAALGAIAHIQAGAINVMSSNWSAALAELDQVEPHLPELAPSEQCATLINRGLAHLSLHDLDPGQRDLEAALSLAIEHDLPMEEFKARHNLGCVAFIAGDLPRALRLMADAAAMDAGVGLARGHLDHGKVLLDAGLVDEAEEVLGRGLEAARRDRQPLEGADIQLDLARAALLRGDLPHARGWASHATRTFRRLQATSRADEVELLGAAIDMAMGRRLAQATAVAASWAGTPPVQPSERLATRIRAEIALARHDLETARAEVASLRSDIPAALGVFVHEQLLAARIAEAEGDQEQRRRLMAEAAVRLARDQGSVHSHEMRVGLAFHAARIREADVAMAMASGALGELFDATERWRAASLRAAPIRPPADPEVAGLVGRLRHLRRELATGPRSSETHDVTAEMLHLQSEITERLRGTEGPRATSDVAATTAAEALALAAARRTTLVTFHEISGRVIRLTVDTTVHQRDLGASADIAAATSRAVADVRAVALARPRMIPFLTRTRDSSVRHLDDLLLGDLPLDGSVVIVPTIGLASVPWRALPTLRTHPIVAAPSVSAWARRGDVAVSPIRVAALAGPRLSLAPDEVASVRQAWASVTGSPSGSSERLATAPTRHAASADVRSALASASVVHLAAHGHHVDQSPLFSSLDMGDGPVFAHELTAPLAAELVVLSACDVGRSRGRSGDEPLGLAAALLSLGAQCVVAATNPVRDDVAAEAMAALHTALAGGVDVATALRDVAAEVPGAEAFCAYGSTWRRAD